MFEHRNHVHPRGFSLVEITFALVILVTVAMTLAGHMTTVYRQNGNHKDKAFAYGRAAALLAEMKAWVDRTEGASANSLDSFDDGVVWNPVLSIAEKGGAPIEPDHPLSGNLKRDGRWLWARRITVKPFPGLNNRNVRYVTIRIGKDKGDGNYVGLAELSGVVNSVGDNYPPSQVYDVYLLALENVPGWWVFMDAIRPFVESTITDLEARNPGVKFRTHWITKSAYGRNRLYAPFLNKATDSKALIPEVYFYPGKMPTGSASSWYYVPDLFQARVRVDGAFVNDYDASENPYPYALADRFNHAMRLPEERELFDARVAAGLEDPDTPTWRLLLEDMATNPSKYRNAILINLHGELLPMPAMRNYSDAAKAPLKHPGLRVVTHPERLRYLRASTVSGSEDVTFRVYAWRRDPSKPGDGRTEGDPITLQIMNVDLTKNVNGKGTGPLTLRVQRLEGGVDPGNGDMTYKPFADAPTAPSGFRPREMWFRADFVDGSGTGGESYTLLELHNTPSIAPVQGSSPKDKGLYSSRRLYGMEYIPCSTESANDFSTDLSTSGKVEKNTARWRIQIPKEVLDGATTGSRLDLSDHVLEVRTRIGTDLTTGKAFPTPYQPDNLSRTWVYWTSNKESVPFTERYQFLGDPRHCPYADLKNGGANFPNGYNWFFDNFSYTKNRKSWWPGFDPSRLRDRWRGRVEINYARYAQLLRTSLTKSRAVYTTLTGFSYYYVGLGNEIGYDSANGYPNSIPLNLAPYGASGWGYIDNISGGGNSKYRYQKIIREGGGGNYWWGRYWLGELYPDSMAAIWESTGNLPAGNALGEFYRDQRYDITVGLPEGTRLYNANRRTATEGCTSVFNIGSTSSTFHHQFASGTNGTLVGAGTEIAQNYNFPLPTTTKISRPFDIAINYSGWVGDEFFFNGDFPKFSAVIEKTYYRHSSGREGSSLVGLTSPSGEVAHIVVNGLDRTTESGSAFIAKFSVLSLLHSFFEAGNPTLADPISLPPRVEIASPTDITELKDPSDVPITWTISWKRWDGKKYAGSFPSGYTGNENDLEYTLSYSVDGGKTWKYVQDDSPATPGERPADPFLLLADTGPGDETYLWATPSGKFPEGSYLLQVEAYRNGSTLHYSFHRTKIFLQR